MISKRRVAMTYYCLKIELTTEVVNYLNRIGVSIVPEKINGESYLRLDCPEGTQEEYADIVTQETMYRVVTPSRGIFYIRYLLRPKLPNGNSQCLLFVYESDMQRLEGNADAPQAHQSFLGDGGDYGGSRVKEEAGRTDVHSSNCFPHLRHSPAACYHQHARTWRHAAGHVKRCAE